jgi:hypothetical protein
VPTPHTETAGSAITNSGLRMPRRDTTRAEARKRRVDEERRENEEAALHAMTDSIPPF